MDSQVRLALPTAIRDCNCAEIPTTSICSMEDVGKTKMCIKLKWSIGLQFASKRIGQ